jgi:quercetin dioxygenase-like cupin family protein
MAADDIATRPIHLGLGASAEVEPLFTGALDWYAAYSERHRSDGAEGRLVGMFSFDQAWITWEMHPHGSEVVLCTAGKITLHQQHPNGSQSKVVLNAGRYAINPPGIWHTADVDRAATAVFITAGLGTELRPR